MKKLFCALMLPAVLLFTVFCTELPNKIDRTETKAEADADTGHGVINNGGVDTTPGFGELYLVGGKTDSGTKEEPTTPAKNPATEKPEDTDTDTDTETDTDTDTETDTDTDHDEINNGGADTTPGFGELHPIGGN